MKLTVEAIDMKCTKKRICAETYNANISLWSLGCFVNVIHMVISL